MEPGVMVSTARAGAAPAAADASPFDPHAERMVTAEAAITAANEERLNLVFINAFFP